MNSFRFTKMHGLGNSYIYVNQFEEQLPEEKLSEIAIQVSSVYTGIGSDGMIDLPCLGTRFSVFRLSTCWRPALWLLQLD